MPDEAGAVGPWERHLAEPFAGRKVVCAFEVLAAMTASVAELQRWGAQRPMLVADGTGTGPLPLESDADIVVMERPTGQTLTEQVRARMRPGDWLSAKAAVAVVQYDPDEEAVWWVGPPCLNTPLLDRPVLGGRPRAQARLEDKTLVDGLLAAAGAAPAPSLLCDADHRSLLDASATLGASVGEAPVVWAGDARDGVNGGSDFVRLVRTAEQARAAADFFAARCDRVRVSTFLVGVPCSVHGIVLPDGVVVLRPLELASLRDDANGRFAYAGMGTGWDPPADDTEAMRGLARSVGLSLQSTHGYRGAFSLDGVLTEGGFEVTELNSRFSGGMTRFSRASPDSHLDLVQINAVLGRDVERSAAEIEEHALTDLDRSRFVDVMGFSSAVRPTETTQVLVASDDGGLGLTVDESAALGSVALGPSSSGGFVRMALDGDAVAPGVRTADLAVQLLGLADDLWGTEFGALTMPPDVRGPRG